MVLVFDMDDTLYEEITYVRSGFKAVSVFLSPLLGKTSSELYAEMNLLLKDLGRGAVFDTLLERHNHFSGQLVRKCVSCYRLHYPDINLHDFGRQCLHRFSKLPLYVVTDGNKVAQHNKVRSLGLDDYVKKVFVTHRYGLCHAKPSPYCFRLIQKVEKVEASQIVYVGDNPAKDFVGISPLGFRTIRVLTGPYAKTQAKPGFDADIALNSLNELTPDLLRTLET